MIFFFKKKKRNVGVILLLFFTMEYIYKNAWIILLYYLQFLIKIKSKELVHTTKELSKFKIIYFVINI